jgi:hypothetical protein
MPWFSNAPEHAREIKDRQRKGALHTASIKRERTERLIASALATLKKSETPITFSAIARLIGSNRSTVSRQFSTHYEWRLNTRITEEIGSGDQKLIAANATAIFEGDPKRAAAPMAIDANHATGCSGADFSPENNRP